MTKPAITLFKGRGAVSNVPGRFEALQSEAFDDGWDQGEEPPRALETIIGIEAARSIISYNESPDIGFDRSLNTYRGCEHGCIYCYARPNHAYVGLSPGLDFERRLFVKADAAKLLERELAAPNYQPQVIMLGGVTDCYQPEERTRRVTRAVLEVLAKAHHPLAITTKSALVLRDLDLLAPMAQKGLARVAISLTTLDPVLARKMEPRAAAPHRRLEAITGLAKAGVQVTAMMAPIIPALNDHEIESLLEAAAKAGADSASFVLLRLPMEIHALFVEWLEAHFPDRAGKVMSLMRQMRGGKAYDSRWNHRQRGDGPYADLIGLRFRRACQLLGLNTPRLPMDCGQFRRPIPMGGQLPLL